jgi:uncharacterized protein YgbK (DUF1537 family)
MFSLGARRHLNVTSLFLGTQLMPVMSLERINGEACVSFSGGVGLITNAAGKAIIVASFP